MAAITPTGSVLLVRLGFRLGETRAAVLRTFRVFQGVGTDTDVFAGIAELWLGPAFANAMSGEIIYEGTWCRRIRPTTTEPDSYVNNGPYAAGFASGALPPQVAGLIRLDADVPSGRNPGRIFVPYVPTEAWDGTSLSAAYTAALDYIGYLQHANLNDLGGSFPLSFLRGTIWHRSTTTNDLITAHEVRRDATQRRRTGSSKTLTALYSPF